RSDQPTVPVEATPTPPPAAEYAAALWPSPSYAKRYEDPRQLAGAFAENYIGFESPVVGGFQPTEPGAGEVEVRPAADGPATMILVRRLGPERSWWATGATTGHIVVDRPLPNAAIGTSLHYSGEARTGPDTITIEIRVDRVKNPVATREFVTTGDAEGHWFEGRFGWAATTGRSGAVVFFSRDDGGAVLEATVIKVRFAADLPPSALPG
ncbi:MAG: hypothetical protein ACR2QK_14270, partial [Acidimicrobiales bacterium]